MTTIDSSSAAESSMDESSHDYQHNLSKKRIHRTSNGHGGFAEDDEQENGEDEGNEGGVELWEAFSKSFSQVQTVLDQNRLLIQQVNENHQSKIPDNLAKNVGLIREINGNISKVVSLYSDLSTNFSNIFHQRHGVDAKNCGSEKISNEGESVEA